MSESVKKKSASNIYFAVDANTGQLVHISEVQSGKKCNCNCAACGKPLEARKGNLRRHHFAHISNYECMYSSEVSIYKALAVLLETNKHITTPPVTLRFPSWSTADVIRPSEEITLDSVVFKCEELAYPPDLFLTVRDSRLRVIIDFAHYYDDKDKRMVFEQEAKQQDYSCLMYHVPGVDKDDSFTPDNLRQLLLDGTKSEWIFNRIEERWRNRFLSVAEQPSEHGLGYECILHEGYYKGKYSARFEDCAYCRYNIATPPNCLCTAKSGIQSISDFTCDPLELQERTDIIRKENDERRARKEAASKMVKSPRIQFHSYPANHSSENTASSPTDTELYEEQQRIAANFNPASPSWTVDRFGRRWIKCKECGSILRDTVMAYYGGPDGVNQGICSACSRKKH